MSDIFVSHESRDAAVAATLVEALRARNFSVWWDGDIAPGSGFRKEIETQLDAARCVIVIWSATSVDSQFVCDEAEHGRKRQCLVPVTLDGALPPMGFREIQAVSLAEWLSGGSSDTLDRLVGGVRRTLGQHVEPVSPPARPTRPWLWIAMMAVGGAFALSVVPPAFFDESTLATLAQTAIWALGSVLLLQLAKSRATLIRWSGTRLFQAGAIALLAFPWLFLLNVVTVQPTITPANAVATVKVDGRAVRSARFPTRLKNARVSLGGDEDSFRLSIFDLFSSFFHLGSRWRVFEAEWRLVYPLNIDCFYGQCPAPLTITFTLDGRFDNDYPSIETFEGREVPITEPTRFPIALHAGRYTVTLMVNGAPCPGSPATIEIPRVQPEYAIRGCARNGPP